MKNDCNLVLYQSDSTALWARNTDNQGLPSGYCKAIINSNGNLELYRGGPQIDNKFWKTKYTPNALRSINRSYKMDYDIL